MTRTFSLSDETLTPGEKLATEGGQGDIVAAIEAIPAGGDATAANQVTGNASLASILTAVDGLETLVTATNAAVDGVEALLTTIDADTSVVNSFFLPSTLRPVAFDSYGSVAVSSVTGANQLVISSAANKQIWVYGWVLAATAAGTVAFQDEDDTALTGAMTVTTASGSARNPSGNLLMPIFKLATDKDLELDVVTATVNGQITYAIVSV